MNRYFLRNIIPVYPLYNMLSNYFFTDLCIYSRNFERFSIQYQNKSCIHGSIVQREILTVDISGPGTLQVQSCPVYTFLSKY